jgi:hypothetical protein
MDRVLFTRPSAERIARVVRIVEQTRPEGAAFVSRQLAESPKPRLFRIATFSGSWSKNSNKTVTLTTTTTTVVATNLFASLTPTGTVKCAVARDGTAWYLIAAEC